VGHTSGLDILEKRISPVSTGNQTTISRSFRPLPVQIYFNLTVMAEGEHGFRQDVEEGQCLCLIINCFLGAFQNFKRQLLVSSYISLFPSVRVEQLGFYWADIHKI
jgi:hypothetical protein